MARGLVYLLIGLLGARIALGDPARADQEGALREIAEQPFGRIVLWLVAVGFAAYGLWRLGEAAWGRRGQTDDKKRSVQRIESLASGLLYLILFVIALRFAGGAASSGSQQDVTARLVTGRGGTSLFLVIGVLVVGIGIALARRGLKTDFEKQLSCGSKVRGHTTSYGGSARRATSPAASSSPSSASWSSKPLSSTTLRRRAGSMSLCTASRVGREALCSSWQPRPASPASARTRSRSRATGGSDRERARRDELRSLHLLDRQHHDCHHQECHHHG